MKKISSVLIDYEENTKSFFTHCEENGSKLITNHFIIKNDQKFVVRFLFFAFVRADSLHTEDVIFFFNIMERTETSNSCLII